MSDPTPPQMPTPVNQGVNANNTQRTAIFLRSLSRQALFNGNTSHGASPMNPDPQHNSNPLQATNLTSPEAGAPFLWLGGDPMLQGSSTPHHCEEENVRVTQTFFQVHLCQTNCQSFFSQPLLNSMLGFPTSPATIDLNKYQRVAEQVGLRGKQADATVAVATVRAPLSHI